MIRNHNSSGPRQRLSVEKRFAIISLLEQGVPRREVMQKYNLKHSSNVTTILKRKDSIIRSMNRDTSQSSKSIRSSKFPMIDKHLKDFVSDHNSNGTRVSPLMLHTTATRLAKQYGVESKFKMTKSYMDKFLMNQKVHCRPEPVPEEKIADPVCDNTITKTDVASDLQSKLLHDLHLFTREHVHKVTQQVDRIMQLSPDASDEEAKQIIQSKEELLNHLHDFSSSTIVTLMETQNIHSIHSFIDLAENLMFRLISLSQSLLMRFTRLSRDIQMQSIADKAVSRWHRKDSKIEGEEVSEDKQFKSETPDRE